MTILVGWFLTKLECWLFTFPYTKANRQFWHFGNSIWGKLPFFTLRRSTSTHFHLNINFKFTGHTKIMKWFKLYMNDSNFIWGSSVLKMSEKSVSRTSFCSTLSTVFYQIKNSLRAGVILGTSVGCRHKDDLYVVHLIFSTLPWDRYYYNLHFPEEGKEVQALAQSQSTKGWSEEPDYRTPEPLFHSRQLSPARVPPHLARGRHKEAVALSLV